MEHGKTQILARSGLLQKQAAWTPKFSLACYIGWSVGLCLVIAVFLSPQIADAQKRDRHETYYYPKISSHETYISRARFDPTINRKERIGFTVAINTLQAQAPYPPNYALFTKGDEAQKMILIGLDEEIFASLYRIRAVLAQMTARARGTDLLRELHVEDLFTFLDVLKLLGFAQLTISDGVNIAHQIKIE